MTRNEIAAAELEAQAEALGIHSKACREGTAQEFEVWSEDCAGCRPAIHAFIDWETNGTERAIEAMNDAWASEQTALDAMMGM